MTRTTVLLLLSLSISACFPSRGVKPNDTSGGDTSGGGDFHPAGWDHGLAAKLQESECIDCHGADLTGGTGPSCDSCHPAGWRTDCTFCHGGVEDSTGAPPDDIDPDSGVSFPEHGVHLVGDHPSWGCDQCHAVPDDILSPGHIFVGDDTPAVAELGFGAGLSSAGGYAGGGSCSNLYCHGNGAGQRGSATSGQSYDCGDCHGGADNPRSLSGRHDDHLEEGVRCGDCHGSTVSGNTTIVGPNMHVNGSVDVVIDELRYSGGTCEGTCHNERHSNEHWEGGGDD